MTAVLVFQTLRKPQPVCDGARRVPMALSPWGRQHLLLVVLGAASDLVFPPPPPPPHLSRFWVRKQPYVHCFSTLGAIHQVIDLMSPRERGKKHKKKVRFQ